MAKSKTVWQFFILWFMVSPVSLAVNAQSDLSLHDSLTAALEKQTRSSFQTANTQTRAKGITDWIYSAPSVSLMRFQSDQALGTNETELSFNVAIKSPFLKQIEMQLDSEIAARQKSAQQQYALYLSGLIRELLWELALEESAFKVSSEKTALLTQLSARLTEMAEAQAVPQYVSLIVQKELIQLTIASKQHSKRVKDLQEKFYRITGLHTLPDEIKEPPLDITQINVHLHPDVRALDAAFQSDKYQLESGGKKASPWNLQLTSRRLSSDSFSENQLGLGVEIPISVGSNLTNLQQAEYIKLSTEYDIAKKKLLSQLSETHLSLWREYEFLQQKQALLNDSKLTIDALSQAMNELITANAPNQEFYIRTLLSNINAQGEVDVNTVLIQRQVARIRQAAGISL